MSYNVLILNIDYTPFDIWEWQKAISKLLCSNSVKPVYNNNGMVKYNKIVRDGQGNEYDLPAVLQLSYYVDVHTGYAPYSKQNIYARDLLICQYCGKFIIENKERTVDHVIPRHKWDSRKRSFKLSSFENVVTACSFCNKKKGNNTPNEAGMKLLNKPRKISRIKLYQNKLNIIKNKPHQWLEYLRVKNEQTST